MKRPDSHGFSQCFVLNRLNTVLLRGPLPAPPAEVHVPEAHEEPPHGGGMPQGDPHLLWQTQGRRLPGPLRHVRVRPHPQGAGERRQGHGTAGDGEVSGIFEKKKKVIHSTITERKRD